MWKAIADESKLALLHILLDRIQGFLLGDLEGWSVLADQGN